jgi:hypothetical protein
MARCPNCSAEVARDATFCGTCGERLPKRGSRRFLFAVLGLVLAVAVGAGASFLLFGAEDEARGETIRFQEVDEAGDDPFTSPTDRQGRDTVRVQAGGSGKGPFGGTGSNRVCDRELLIRSLARAPERMREFARVLGVEPTQKAVAAYIRKLRPVTLTRDTRVTNHTFEDGRAVPVQDILQAGTAVLADANGDPVVRCRCGNPLAAPRSVSDEVRCIGCPANYDTSQVCDAGPRCYRRYPSPPPVRGGGEGCRVRDRLGRQLLVRVLSGDLPCEEAAAVFRRYHDPSTPLQGSGAAGQIGEWFCISRVAATPYRSDLPEVQTGCKRGGDEIVTVPVGSGSASAPPTSAAGPETDVVDCPSPSGGAGTGITDLSARRLSCNEALRTLEGVRFVDREPTISGWSCTTLDPGALGEGATYRCTQGAQAIRWSVGD